MFQGFPVCDSDPSFDKKTSKLLKYKRKIPLWFTSALLVNYILLRATVASRTIKLIMILDHSIILYHLLAWLIVSILEGSCLVIIDIDPLFNVVNCEKENSSVIWQKYQEAKLFPCFFCSLGLKEWASILLFLKSIFALLRLWVFYLLILQDLLCFFSLRYLLCHCCFLQYLIFELIVRCHFFLV